MKTRLLVLIVLMLNAACTTLPLSQEELAVKITTNPASTCTQVGQVHVPGIRLNQASRFDDLKRDTLKLGGDTVQILTTNQNGTIDAIAFKCGANG